MRLYYAHPWNTFGTELEAAVEVLIRDRWPEATIVNPNAPEHQAGYAARQMAYYVEDVLPGCDGCVFYAFRDGLVGAGVAMEATFYAARGRPVWEALIGQYGEHLVVEGLRETASLPLARVLTREQTWAYIYANPGAPREERVARPW